jgi:hypothetical protein
VDRRANSLSSSKRQFHILAGASLASSLKGLMTSRPGRCNGPQSAHRREAMNVRSASASGAAQTEATGAEVPKVSQEMKDVLQVANNPPAHLLCRRPRYCVVASQHRVM